MDVNLSGGEQLTKAIVEELLSEHIMPYDLDTSLHIYELQSATEETYKDLSQILAASICYYFNATCGELLWDHYRELKYANQSLDGYWRELLMPSISNDYSYYETALGICRIYAKYRSPDFDFDLFFSNCTAYLVEHTD